MRIRNLASFEIVRSIRFENKTLTRFTQTQKWGNGEMNLTN